MHRREAIVLALEEVADIAISMLGDLHQEHETIAPLVAFRGEDTRGNRAWSCSVTIASCEDGLVVEVPHDCLTHWTTDTLWRVL
mmetsp:Transcript_35038/g.85154  ORF Transcript_35038/g.85154 Transcript_35038/m.85154 type:complete len:84 (-) Transcript_35038:95-346(-)